MVLPRPLAAAIAACQHTYMRARMLDAEPGGRLPDAAYTEAAWRIRAIAPDFALEDVWELPGEGRREDFPKLLELVCRMDPERGVGVRRGRCGRFGGSSAR